MSIHTGALNLFSTILSKKALLAIGYESMIVDYMYQEIDHKPTFMEYHWKMFPDDFENCGGYIP